MAVDRELMLSYKESTTGVILHEGINEAGSVASFTAVGSSYSTHDEPMIPIYIFYSMFGFQRTGDAFWRLLGDFHAKGLVAKGKADHHEAAACYQKAAALGEGVRRACSSRRSQAATERCSDS
jgi:pyruvate dehydrogenase complex dehydrogenase (E1) component